MSRDGNKEALQTKKNLEYKYSRGTVITFIDVASRKSQAAMRETTGDDKERESRLHPKKSTTVTEIFQDLSDTGQTITQIQKGKKKREKIVFSPFLFMLRSSTTVASTAVQLYFINYKVYQIYLVELKKK